MDSGTETPMDSTFPHPLEKYLLETHGVTREQLHRIGMFLLGHVLIDMGLISLDPLFERRARRVSQTDLDAWRKLIDRSARRRFSDRLKDAIGRKLISEYDSDLAEKANTARNTFLHFATRWRLPEFKGLPIIEERGLRRYLDDVLDHLNRQQPSLEPTN